jgi:NitT/TauT family transport system ATP-binding protein
VNAVSLRGVSKSFGDRDVFAPIDLDIAPGQFVSIIGPSGCGKSTLLRIVAGLVPASAGTVVVAGEPAVQARNSKHVAMVPQQPGLLPWRTVEANARLLLDINSKANAASATTPTELLQAVGLGDSLRLYPYQLSGGMQQRVALVRALALGAPLLLLDEPFAALDEITRADMRGLLNRLIDGRLVGDVTTLLVTHSVTEAVALSDRILVMSPRPARIVGGVEVDLPRPRDAELDDDPAFVSACSTVRQLLREAMSAPTGGTA